MADFAQNEPPVDDEEPPAEGALFPLDSDEDGTPDWLLEAEFVLNSTSGGSGGEASGDTSPASPRPPPIAVVRSKERSSSSSRIVREPARTFPANESTPLLLGSKGSAGGIPTRSSLTPREKRCTRAQAEAAALTDSADIQTSATTSTSPPLTWGGESWGAGVSWKALAAIYDGLLAPPSTLPLNSPAVGMVLTAGAGVFLSCALAA